VARGQLIGVLVALLAPEAMARQGFGDVAALASEGRLVEARALAGSIEDPLTAAQARVHVAWSGGDLVGALSEGERALAQHPGDLYLLEQCSQLAVALGASERAVAHAGALAASAADAELSDEERSDWKERALAVEDAARELETLHRRRARSLVLARGTVLVAALFAALLLLWPWRRLARAASSA
jgi:hypothetical protein